MEPKFQTSFIPKKPIVTAQGSGVNVVHNTNILSVIATVVFIVAIMSSVALFVYKNVLTSQIADDDQQITVARTAFQPEKIQELVDANSKITAAAHILDNHVLVSKVLLLFQQLTVKKMRFDDFEYTDTNDTPSVTISGEVQTYNALAEQQSIFLNDQSMINPTFYDFTLADNGYIIFSFTSTFDPSLISYKNSLAANG